MSDVLITADHVSRDLIRYTFEAAFMDFELDSEGDVCVKDGCNVHVLLDKERNRIALICQFTFKSSSSEMQRLEAVNKINMGYLFVSASARPQDTLRFEYDIFLDGGMSKKGLVLAVKRFASIPFAAVKDYAHDIVE